MLAFPLGRCNLAGYWNGPPALFSAWTHPQRDPAASPPRRRAQAWCSWLVAPCAPEDTLAVSSPHAASLDSSVEHPVGRW